MQNQAGMTPVSMTSTDRSTIGDVPLPRHSANGWCERGRSRTKGLVSTAKRTVETWNLVSEAFATTVEARFSERLYHASADRLLSELQAVTGRTVLLIAHNPGIADFAARLVTEPPQHPRFDDYPTGATTIIAFPAGTWSDIRWHTGRVTDFVTPRDLLE